MSIGPWNVRVWDRFYDSLYPTAKPDDHQAYRRGLLANLSQPGRFDAVRARMFRSDAPVWARFVREAHGTPARAAR